MVARRAALLLTLLGATASPARAHVGAMVSNARFTTPTGPTLGDGGSYDLAGFQFTHGDASVDVAWTDGDFNPTGKFVFYYLPSCPTFEILVDDIERIATKIPGVPGSSGIWAGCTCSEDMGMGVICPDAGDRASDCANDFTWDTSALAAGAYWVMAVNNDPPFHVYSVSSGPVIISHGAAVAPPAAIIIKPDTVGAFDKTYTTQWIATGQAPLRFDLYYGVDEYMKALDPPTLLAENITPINNPDGSFGYVWDVSQLPNTVYFLRVKVTDANGQSTYTDSRYGLTVYHPFSDGGSLTPDDLSVAVDMGVPAKRPGCSSCDMAPHDPAIGLGPLALLVFGGLGGTAWLGWRRRQRR